MYHFKAVHIPAFTMVYANIPETFGKVFHVLSRTPQFIDDINGKQSSLLGLLHNMFYTAMTTHSWLLELLCITLEIPALYDYLYVLYVCMYVCIVCIVWLFWFSRIFIVYRSSFNHTYITFPNPKVFNILFKDPACHFQCNLLIPYMYY